MRQDLGSFLVFVADNWPWAVVLWIGLVAWFMVTFGRTAPFSRRSGGIK